MTSKAFFFLIMMYQHVICTQA